MAVEPDFDYESYEKSLALILEQASKEYWAQHIDINRHQIMVGRTYLWVSAALLGSYFTILTVVRGDGMEAPSSVCFWLLSGGAVLLAALAFGVCLYALPGRRGYMRVTESWRILAGDAYRGLEAQSKSIYRTTLTNLIEKVDEGADIGLATNQTRANWLRKTSWLLVCSFSLAVASVAAYTIELTLSIGG